MSHPVIECVDALGAVLKDVADVNPTFMATGDKATALLGLAAVQTQVAELRLRVMAAAGDVAEAAAARDVAAWLHHHTRVRPEDARADLALATSIDRSHTTVAAALREGTCNTAQARAIVAALEDLPADIDPATRRLAETTLVGYATRFDPTQLRRLGRRILDVIAPDIAEAAEARKLADLEAHARHATRLTLRPLGDGTTQITAILPDPIAHRLATYLQAFTNPRQAAFNLDSSAVAGGNHAGATPTGSSDDPAGEATGAAARGEVLANDPSGAGDDVRGRLDTVLTRLPYPRRLGQAFCQLMEAVDPQRLPVHGGDATTVIVTISLDTLRKELGAGEMLGGDNLTATEIRRLACTAKIIPAVLDGAGQLLDLGRGRRLLEGAQRRALLLRDRTCRAEGCDVPGTWSEAHHWTPWSAGGPTDLTNAVLLCSHHHHRAHDPTWTADRLPNGDVRFARRR